MDFIISLKEIVKIYGKGESKVVALNKVSLDICKGDYISVMGPSGSGKSTLLNIIGCMDTPTTGQYILKGRDVSKLKRRDFSQIRNKDVSFVFQSFALLNNYSVYHNVELPLCHRRMSRSQKKEIIMHYLDKLGIANLANKRPTEISGGQQQRVAIARALASDADIILADEPTGSLDQKTGQEIMELLTNINSEGKTIVIVTHDKNVASYCRRNILIVDGRIVEDNISDNISKNCSESNVSL